MSDTLYTLQESAEYLKVHWQTVRNYLKQGKIPYSKAGKSIRIRKHDLDSFLQNKQSSNDNHNLEYELRFKVTNRKQFETRLINLGSYVTYHSHVIDHWYVPHNINSVEQNQMFYESPHGFGLRIREQDNNYTGNITTTAEIKNLVDGKDHNLVIENEMPIKDYETANAFFRSLSLKEFISIDKERLMYSYNDFKITLDIVKDLGTFTDIELSKIKSAKQAKIKVLNLAKKLGIKESDMLEKSVTFLAIKTLSKF